MNLTSKRRKSEIEIEFEISTVTAILNYDENLFYQTLKKHQCIDQEIAESGMTPLHLAILTNFTAGVRILLSFDVDANKTIKSGGLNITPLDLAKRFNREKIIYLLSENTQHL